MKASTHETARYRLRSAGSYVDGEWTHYLIISTSGKGVVGSVTPRSGGGWVATLPVRDPETFRKIRDAIGRGATPDEALKDADAKALQGGV